MCHYLSGKHITALLLLPQLPRSKRRRAENYHLSLSLFLHIKGASTRLLFEYFILLSYSGPFFPTFYRRRPIILISSNLAPPFP